MHRITSSSLGCAAAIALLFTAAWPAHAAPQPTTTVVNEVDFYSPPDHLPTEMGAVVRSHPVKMMGNSRAQRELAGSRNPVVVHNSDRRRCDSGSLGHGHRTHRSLGRAR